MKPVAVLNIRSKNMGKKKNGVSDVKTGSTQMGWVIVSVVALIISAGFIAKIVFVNNDAPVNINQNASTQSPDIVNNDARVQLVASRFRCACGGCGELPLDECTCDMPRGAVEEKNFIRNKLQQGLTIDQVVKAVDEKYGHMKT
jgi:hypothetical protein